jgi:hypothetical protein
MNRRGRWSRGFPALAALTAVAVVAAVTLPARVTQAEAAFRKKKAAPATESTDTTASEGSGEIGNTPAEGGEAAPAAPKLESVPQAEDRDRPVDPTLIEKQQAEAALRAQQDLQKKNAGPPFYTKWQFWAIAGGVVVGLAVAIIGGLKLSHEINGGDVRQCNPDFTDGCFGAGH